MRKVYDKAYFDRWYRTGLSRVQSAASLARKVRLAIGVAEYHLGRPIRSVLDVGCGEGAWLRPLRALRPDVCYLGLDSSDYAIARYGQSRNLRLCRFSDLAVQRFEGTVDLLVCSDMMHYVPTAELVQGLSGFAELCHGVAFLEVFCKGDRFHGDTDGFIARTAAWYRKAFARAGFLHCGNHCYLGPERHIWATALELATR